MDPDQGLPLTQGQLDIWLAQEMGSGSAEWNLGFLGRIAGWVDRGRIHEAIRQVVKEVEPGRAGFFEVGGLVVQRAIDFPDVALDFYDLTGSKHPLQDVDGIASSIRRTPMPLAGPLFKLVVCHEHGTGLT